MNRGFQSIAPVVSGSAGNPDAPGMRCNRNRQVSHCESCTLHQGMGSLFKLRVGLDAASTCHVMQILAIAAANAFHLSELEAFAFPGKAVIRVTNLPRVVD